MNGTVGIVRYGAGNIGNVIRALRSLGIEHKLLDAPAEAEDSCPKALLLPGVGAFRPAMRNLDDSGWSRYLREHCAHGRALVGICLGMQLMCRSSDEDGQTEGLGLFDAKVTRLEGLSKIPHMGWNSVERSAGAEFMEGCEDVYFVHSYAVMSSPDCVGTTEADGVRFCSVLRRGGAIGCQFHPERSGRAGVRALGAAIDSAISGGESDA